MSKAKNILSEPERWNLVEELFDSAMKLNAPERPDFIARVCDGDESLRAELNSLLSSAASGEFFLSTPVFNAGLTLLSEPEEDLSGRVLSKYQLLKLLGRGGMGEVYLAQDRRLNRNVALKILPRDLAAIPERLRRFETEARAASAVTHSNLAHIYEVDEVEGQHFIAMEFVPGRTLRSILQEGPLSLSESLRIAREIVSALSVAHAAGIVHRDIKPENVMVGEDGTVKVLDFGLAKESEFADGTVGLKSGPNIHTEAGALFGTVFYMSPEHLRGQIVDTRTDIWSLGVVLFEMITGRTPFDQSNKGDAIASILDRAPYSLADYDPAPPAILCSIVSRCLEKNREDRFSSASQLLLELRRALSELDNIAPAIEERWAHSTISGTGVKPAAKARVWSRDRSNPASTNPQIAAAPTEIHRFPAAAAISRVANASASYALWPLGLVVAAALGLGLYSIAPSKHHPLHVGNVAQMQMPGNFTAVALSPDGKTTASVAQEDRRSSIWLRDVRSGLGSRLVEPTEKKLSNVLFSPDGSSIYYLQADDGARNLYRIPTQGGAATLIVSKVGSTPALSPDGRKISFIRQSPDGTTSLVTAAADGSGISNLAILKSPHVFYVGFYDGGPAWSPDGSTIACPVSNKDLSGPKVSVAAVSVSDGGIHNIGTKRWSRIEQLFWAKNGDALIMNAMDSSSAPYQVWSLSYPNGETSNFTDAPGSMSEIGYSAATGKLIAAVTEKHSQIWISPGADFSSAKAISLSEFEGGTGLDWTTDGKLIADSLETGHVGIRLIDPATGARTAIISDGQTNIQPDVSADNKFVAFISYRGGKASVWRVNVDGTGLQQLTFELNDQTLSITPDGKSVIYCAVDNNGQSQMFAVPSGGGTPVSLVAGDVFSPRVSPDGKQIAAYYSEPGSGVWKIAMFPITGGTPVRAFELPKDAKPDQAGIRWTPDGKSITYVVTTAEISKFFRQSLSGGLVEEIKSTQPGKILSFSWNPRTGQLAFVRGTKNLSLISMDAN